MAAVCLVVVWWYGMVWYGSTKINTFCSLLPAAVFDGLLLSHSGESGLAHGVSVCEWAGPCVSGYVAVWRALTNCTKSFATRMFPIHQRTYHRKEDSFSRHWCPDISTGKRGRQHCFAEPSHSLVSCPTNAHKPSPRTTREVYVCSSASLLAPRLIESQYS